MRPLVVEDPLAYLGLDIGSSSIKGAVLDSATGSVTNVRARPFPDPVGSLPAFWFEVDPAAVVVAVRSLIEELLGEVGTCEGIVACGQMGGVLLTDDAGQAVTNYLSWRDQRVLEPSASGAGTVYDRLLQRISASDQALIGHELRPGAAISLLFWLTEHGLLPARARAMGLGEFVVAQLCEEVPRAHATQALGTWNLETRQWHTPLFEQLGFGQLAWPELIESTQPAGHYDSARGAIPCFAVIGDQQAALYGARLRERELSVNVSTGSQVSLLTPAPRLGNYQTRPYFHGEYLNTITHLPAGRSLNVLIDLLTELARGEGVSLRDPWSTVARAVDAVPSSDLDVSLAYFAGPLGSAGHIQNIRLDNLSVGHLFRAAFQQMADDYFACACRLSPGRDWDRVVFSGGLPQKLPALRRMIADRFGVPDRIVAVAEETLQGLLALVH